MVASTLGGGLLLVALARRRRRGDPLTAEGLDGESRGTGAAVGAALAPSPVPPDEAHIPRWRRPSLRAERSGAGHVTGARRPPLVFPALPDPTAERQILRFDQVTLTEEPDEALGRVLGMFRAGDEVDVLERGPIWALVRTPTGQTGWVQAVTLAAYGTVLEQEQQTSMPEVIDDAPEPDAPSLESLLEAIIAERRASALAATADVAAAPSEDTAAPPSEEAAGPAAPSRPKRTARSRSRPAAT